MWVDDIQINEKNSSFEDFNPNWVETSIDLIEKSLFCNYFFFLFLAQGIKKIKYFLM